MTAAVGPWSGWGRSAAQAGGAWAAAAAGPAAATGRRRQRRKSSAGRWKIAAGTGTVLGLLLGRRTGAAGRARGQISWFELKTEKMIELKSN